MDTNSLRTDDKKSISIVIPVYNEEDNLAHLRQRLEALCSGNQEYNWSVCLVDDGSKDASREIIRKIVSENSMFRAVFLSRNFGHQAALSAGLDLVDADYVAVLDGDLQDPPELIPQMVKQLENGVNMLYGKRISRSGESFLKKITAVLFYRILSLLTNVSIPVDTGDFRVFDRKLHVAIKSMRERHRFLRGMFAWAGYRVEAFNYKRHGRFAGVTKYSWRSMFRFAANALFSFSDVPLRLATYAGVVVALMGGCGMLYILVLKFLFADYIAGVSAVLFAVFLIGGIQLIILGICGAYIGRIFEEVKNRPLYLIDETLNLKT